MIGGPDERGVYATVSASPFRRLFAVGVLYALGAMVIWLAVAQPPALGYQVFLVVFGAVTLWIAERLRRATLLEVWLFEDRIEDSSGAVLARLDDIASIDRSIFAFKPSNGFLLRLKTRAPGSWQPGLWWRMGRRVGIGGVTPSGQAKFMAEQIAFRLARQTG